MSKDPLHHKIRKRYQLNPASHMMHLQNMRSILADGCIWSYNAMHGRKYLNLANDDVQVGRAGIIVPASQRPLHDYVPLYFGFKTPMVACNQGKNEQLVFLRVSLDILAQPGVIISDGNARSAVTRFESFRDLDVLSMLDPKAINTLKYAHDHEIKRRKQAEILVPDRLFIDQGLDIICFSQVSAEEVVKLLKLFSIKKSVQVNKGWYFLPPAVHPEV